MRTLKKVEIKYIYVDCLPDKIDLEENILYISKIYNGSTHLCLCGCGIECYLNLNIDAGWIMIESNDKITISPSILQRFECKSHYIITNNIANFI
jgi:hypothetical protein